MTSDNLLFPQMRIARGKVVGNNVVVEGEPLPDGSRVTMWVEAPDGFDLDDSSVAELDESNEAIERGEGITLEALMQRLRLVHSP